MSILENANANVACLGLCRIISHVACRISENALSHVTIFVKALLYLNKLTVACQIIDKRRTSVNNVL